MPPKKSVPVDSTALTSLTGSSCLSQDLAWKQVDGGEAMGIIQAALAFLKVFLGSRAALAAEDMAPEQQLRVVAKTYIRGLHHRYTRAA